MKTLFTFKKSLLLFSLTFALRGAAQEISWGGLVDLEIRKAGDNANILVNQTPNKNWSMFIPNARLFGTVEFSDKIWFDVALQSDHYGQRRMHDVFFSLINLNIQPIKNSDFTIQVGRMIIPFGYNHKKFLSSDNPFANLPLASSRNLRVDNTFGYVPAGPLNYNAVAGQSIIFQRRYTQGISFQGTYGDDQLVDYNIALTNSPASGYSEVGQGSVSLIGRVVLKPVIWAKVGASFSYGAYLNRENTINEVIPDDQFNQFKQTAYAVDVNLNYSYFEFSAQYLRNEWTAPYIFILLPQNEINYEPIEGLGNTHWLAETKINLPFWVGAYIAARYEQLNFDNVLLPIVNINEERPWSPATERVELVVGYKITRDIIAKMSYQDAAQNQLFKNDYVFTSQLSVRF